MMIIDATDLILGRMASKIAKLSLLGEKIEVVNCEKAVITGEKSYLLRRYKQRKDRGIPLKGPYFPRMPDRIVRRTIRGMLPYKQGRGKEAFKNVMCHIGIPDELKDKKAETIKEANISKVPSLRYLSVGEISKVLGAKI